MNREQRKHCIAKAPMAYSPEAHLHRAQPQRIKPKYAWQSYSTFNGSSPLEPHDPY